MFAGAKWVGSPVTEVHTGTLADYEIQRALPVFDGKAELFFAARDLDNGLRLMVDVEAGRVYFYEHTDRAWEGPHKDGFHKEVYTLGEECGYFLPGKELFVDKEQIDICLHVKERTVSLHVEDALVVEDAEILPEQNPVRPRKNFRMLEGVRDGAGEPFTLRCICPAVMVKKAIIPAQGKEVQKAVLYTTARGFYDCYMNGEKVSGDYFSPGFTDYRLRIDYQEYDITEKVINAEMAIYTAIIGKGYYSGFVGYSGAHIYGTENSFLSKLVFTYTDGTVEEVCTDEKTLYTDKCPVIYADYLDGEYYDARLEDELEKPESWIPCGIKEAPGEVIPTNGTFPEEKKPVFTLTKQDYPGARCVQVLKSVASWEQPKGHFVYDFGQNMVGTVRVSFRGQRGKSYKLRYGEMCYQNGEIYVQNLRTAANTDVYVCKGAEEETFEPSLVSHGFRYVEVTGNGYDLESGDDILSMEGLVISNIGQQVGDFSCSDELLNKLQSNIRWGQIDNYLLTLTDCPQRNERMGWTGDAQVFAPTAVFNMEARAFTEKWLHDLRDAQLMYNRGGGVPDTAPLGGDNRRLTSGGWGDACVLVPWELYLEYGDKKILEDNFDMMQGWVEYQRGYESEPGIQGEQPRGDHLAYDTSTPFLLCATAYAARSADLFARICGILGKDELAASYETRFAEIKAAYQRKWVKEDGTLTVPTQTGYALSIDFDLLEEKHFAGAAADFLRTIEERNGHLSVGFLGIAHLLPALTKLGRDDVAISILMKKENPGWLYSVLNGATTIWERWNSYIAETDTFGDVNMNSFNHYAYGAVGDWMYQNLLGIRRLTPGYEAVLLAPKPLGGLTHAEGYHICNFGKISVGWTLENGAFRYSVEAPEGVSVTVRMPDGAEYENAINGDYTCKVPVEDENAI